MDSNIGSVAHEHKAGGMSCEGLEGTANIIMALMSSMIP